MIEYFEYDKLDRLECADFDPAPGCPEKHSYGPRGNIVHKPGFGLIDYGAGQTTTKRTYFESKERVGES